MPNYRNPAEAGATLDMLDRFLEEAGRSRSQIGIEPRISYGTGDVKPGKRSCAAGRRTGATTFHLIRWAAVQNGLRNICRPLGSSLNSPLNNDFLVITDGVAVCNN